MEPCGSPENTLSEYLLTLTFKQIVDSFSLHHIQQGFQPGYFHNAYKTMMAVNYVMSYNS